MGAEAATPFVALLEALRQDLDLREDDPRVLDVAEGTLYAYLEVRVQDDLVDEPDAWERSFVYVVGLLGAASTAAFARAAGPRGPRFFDFRAEVLRDFSRVAVREVDRQRVGAPLEAARVGDKFLPLAVCLGALAASADRSDLFSDLTRFVGAAGRGLQLVNDVLNVAEDRRAGRATLPLEAIAPAIGSAATPSSRLQLLVSDACRTTLDDARTALEGAERIATQAGLSALAGVVARRRPFVDSVPARLLALELGGAPS